MTSLSLSALQVRLHRLWLRVDHRRDGVDSQTFTPCSCLTSARAPEPHRPRCLLPLATQRLQPPVGESWDGFHPRLAPPVALALQVCVRTHAHVLMFMDVSAARDSSHSYNSIRPDASSPLMLQCTEHALSFRALRSRTTLRAIQWRWNCTLFCVLVKHQEYDLFQSSDFL